MLTLKQGFLLALLVAVCSLCAAGQPAAWTQRLQIQLPSKASAFAFSKDGSRIAVGHADGSVTIWATDKGTKLSEISTGPSGIRQLRFIDNDSTLLSLSEKKVATFYSASDGKKQRQLNDIGYSFGISPDEKWLVSQDADQAIWLWDLGDLKKAAKLSEPGKGGVRTYSFTSDGKYLFGSYGGNPFVADLANKQIKQLQFNQSGKSTKVKIESDKNGGAAISLGAMQDDDAPAYIFLIGSKTPVVVMSRQWMKGFVDIWDREKQTRLTKIQLSDDEALYQTLGIAISPDDQLVAVAGKKTTSIWGVRDGKKISSFSESGQMAFSPVRNELAILAGDRLTLYSN